MQQQRFIMMMGMEQNRVVVMLDEEISRLQQVRTILQSLIVVEARVAPLLVAAAAEPETVEPEAPESAPVVRHVSRRGIKTGRRGPRPKLAEPPRPLDAVVPRTPVVVSRSALAASKAVATSPTQPSPEATLEGWVRAFRKGKPAA